MQQMGTFVDRPKLEALKEESCRWASFLIYFLSLEYILLAFLMSFRLEVFAGWVGEAGGGG